MTEAAFWVALVIVFGFIAFGLVVAVAVAVSMARDIRRARRSAAR